MQIEFNYSESDRFLESRFRIKKWLSLLKHGYINDKDLEKYATKKKDFEIQRIETLNKFH